MSGRGVHSLPPPFAEAEAEVVIVGAGIMGYGLAWRLSQQGRRVVIIDRGSPGGEASGAAAGILAAQIEAQGSEALLSLSLASRALYPRWAQALKEETGQSVGLRRCGVLMLAGLAAPFREADLQAQAALLVEQRAAGLRVDALSPAEVHSLEPALAEVAGALHFPDDGQVEPQRLLAALVAAAQRNQVSFVRGAVQRLHLAQVAGGAHVVSFLANEGTEPRQIRAEKLVLCAGSWSSIISGTPLPPPSIEPVRGQMVELFRAPSPIQHVCFGHVPSRFSAQRESGAAASHKVAGEAGHGYLVPRGDGRIVIGSTTERVGFVKEVTAAGLLDLLTLAETLSPVLGEAAVTGTWAGLRPGSFDGLPIIGAVSATAASKSPSTVFVCSGHYRNGILLAPASVEALAARICGTALPSELAAVPLSAFAPSRLTS